MLNGAARFYQDVARDYAGGADKQRIALLTGFFEQDARQK
jgi:hypothetical protein